MNMENAENQCENESPSGLSGLHPERSSGVVLNTSGVDTLAEVDSCFGVTLENAEDQVGFSRYRDHATAALGMLASTRDSLHKQYMATLQRAEHGSPPLEKILTTAAADTLTIRKRIDRELVKTMKTHVLWDWLEPHPGVRGPHVARLISMIGDPHRFPGRICEGGHHLPSDWAGDCGVDIRAKISDPPLLCDLAVGPIRRGTGVRSIWHYLGVHVDAEGRAPKRRKGQQCTWSTIGRTCLLQPDGIADQIVRWRVEPWRSKYDETKTRISLERGIVSRPEVDLVIGASLEGELKGNAERALEIDCRAGIAESGGAAGLRDEIEVNHGSLRPIQIEGKGNADPYDESDERSGIAESGGAPDPYSEIEAKSGGLRPIQIEGNGNAEFHHEIDAHVGIAESGGEAENNLGIEQKNGLRPIQIEGIAKKVAVKAFVADLLMAWKGAAPIAEVSNE